MWVRGLKYPGTKYDTMLTMSHPMWVRGLKSKTLFCCPPSGPCRTPCGCVDLNSWSQQDCDQKSVAPHVGAWIEIDMSPGEKLIIRVAPHVGAWIEIYGVVFGVDRSTVAPHVGAWIEIQMFGVPLELIIVAPHVGAWIEIPHPALSRMGLRVAPHVGAWIEIRPSVPVPPPDDSRTPCGCVD